MPNCFSLTRRTAEDGPPVALVQIDEEMCEHFKVPCHPKHWHHWWHDTIGFALACGKTFAECRETFKEDAHTLEIIEWLDEHFLSNAWATIGRH